MNVTTNTLAAEHNGTPAHCQHTARGYCRRCPVPAFCAHWSGAAYQFTNADDAVAFARANTRLALAGMNADDAPVAFVRAARFARAR